MNVMEWADERTRAMTVWDVSVLKIYCVLFGLVIGAYGSTYVMENVGWVVVGIMISGGWGMYRWFTAGPR